MRREKVEREGDRNSCQELKGNFEGEDLAGGERRRSIRWRKLEAPEAGYADL